VGFPVLERSNIVRVVGIILNSLPALLISLERTKIRRIIRKFYKASLSMFSIDNIVSFIDISVLPNHTTDTMRFPCYIVPYSISTILPKNQTSSVRFSSFVDLRKFNSFTIVKFFNSKCCRIFKFWIPKFKFR